MSRAAPAVRPPWRCRWFGHAWVQGRAGSQIALFCERDGCEEVRRWPDPPALPRVAVTLDGKTTTTFWGKP